MYLSLSLSFFSYASSSTLHSCQSVSESVGRVSDQRSLEVASLFHLVGIYVHPTIQVVSPSKLLCFCISSTKPFQRILIYVCLQDTKSSKILQILKGSTYQDKRIIVFLEGLRKVQVFFSTSFPNLKPLLCRRSMVHWWLISLGHFAPRKFCVHWVTVWWG